MTLFRYTVEVECDTREQADQVMRERIDVDDDYRDENGLPFDYSLNCWAEHGTIVSGFGTLLGEGGTA